MDIIHMYMSTTFLHPSNNPSLSLFLYQFSIPSNHSLSVKSTPPFLISFAFPLFTHFRTPPSSDFSDYTYISISACPSQAASPVLPRRDSILKHFGSVKSEKRVSIKNDAPIVLEYISEKAPNRSSTGSSSGGGKTNGSPMMMTPFDVPVISTSSPVETEAPSTIVVEIPTSATATLTLSAAVATVTSAPRPASLLLSKSHDHRSVYKLVRSPSIDRQDSTGADDCRLIPAATATTTAATFISADPSDSGNENGDPATMMVLSPTASQVSQKHSSDCCDESAPLVQSIDGGGGLR